MRWLRLVLVSLVLHVSQGETPKGIDELFTNGEWLRDDLRWVTHACSTGVNATVTAEVLKTIVNRNRASLGSVGSWIDQGHWKASYFGYGIPDFALGKIDLAVGPMATIADILALATRVAAEQLDPAASCGKGTAGSKQCVATGQTSVRYLELGVSVGKTLWQVAESVTTGSLVVGVDVEDVNPKLASLLGADCGQLIESWEMHADHLIRKDGTGRMHKYDCAQPGGSDHCKCANDVGCCSCSQTGCKAEVRYVSGDEMEPGTWARVKEAAEVPQGAGRGFHVVLSDALHHHSALMAEGRYLLDGLLHDSVAAVVWDDLDASEEVRSTFANICNSLVSLYPGSACVSAKLYGWLGEHEYPHLVGMWASADMLPAQCAFLDAASAQGGLLV